MARLKLVVFALLALGLWLASLSTQSESVSANARSEAEAYAARAAEALTVRLDARRAEVQGTVLKVFSSPALWSALGTQKPPAEEPNPATYAAVRDAVLGGFSEEDRAALLVGMDTGGGALYSKGSAAGAVSLEGLEPDAVAQAGTAGLVRTTFGEPYVFFSVPLSLQEKVEGKPVPFLILGAPLLRTSIVAEVASEMRLTALGLVLGKKMLVVAGPDGSRAQEGLDKAIPGGTAVLSRASGTFGPLKLPLGLKEGAPLLVAVRQTLSAAPIEMVAVTSAEPLVKPWMDAQRTSLYYLSFAGLGGVIALLVMGGNRGPRRSDDVDEAGKASDADLHAGAPGDAPPVEPLSAALTTADLQPHSADEDSEGTVASASPFAFPPPPEPGVEAAERAASGASLFDFGTALAASPERAGLPPPVPAESEPARPPPAGLFAPFDFDNHPTAAYPSPPSPESYAQHEGFQPPPGNATDYNPDATRVALVPSELIAQSQRNAADQAAGANVPLPSSRSLAAPTSLSAATVAPDEQHFQEVFRDFVATRERCGEPADGLTFEKFSLKLRKNRDQLVQKYACRTVRFQVYVKEGKAALKATPVKD